MFHAFLLCLLSLWGKREEEKASSSPWASHIRDIYLWACFLPHRSPNRVRRRNEETHMHDSRGHSHSLLPKISVTPVENRGVFALAPCGEPLPVVRISLSLYFKVEVIIINIYYPFYKKTHIELEVEWTGFICLFACFFFNEEGY